MFLINPYSFGGNNLFAVTSYTGSGSTQSIVTGQNQAVGALDWIKRTDSASTEMIVVDTARGGSKYFRTTDNGLELDFTSGRECAFLSNGIQVNSNGDGYTNTSAGAYVALSWLEQAGYMDVVTYTGNGSNRTISHDLAIVAPSLMIIKERSSSEDWIIYHASLGNTSYAILNSTSAASTSQPTVWNSTTPTSSVFSLGTATNVNQSGNTYVAYLFAEKAGKSKFGSYSGTGSTNSITGLGFAPSVVLIKRTTSTGGNWQLFYNVQTTPVLLIPNNTNAAVSGGFSRLTGLSDGFRLDNADGVTNASGSTYIYAAWG